MATTESVSTPLTVEDITHHVAAINGTQLH
jgi:hypothetical protein